VDGRGGLAVELLVDDGLQQGLEGVLIVGEQAAGSDAGDQARENRIGFLEMLNRGRKAATFSTRS
jgi:hypothetical protein